MSLRDKAIGALRQIFGAEREERLAAESPSKAAAMQQPSSIFSMYGRSDLQGMLSVSQALIDRFGDYEAMEEYPDIKCIAEGSLVYIYDKPFVKAVPIEQLATSGGADVVGVDVSTKHIKSVVAQHPRITGRDAEVVKLRFTNGRTLRCTPNHKIFTPLGYIEAKDLKEHDPVYGVQGLSAGAASVPVDPRVWVIRVKEAAVADGTATVFDITTETCNFVCEGIVVHNSAFRYYASDATQPNVADGRALWVSAEDRAIKAMLDDDLIKRRLRAEDEVHGQAYTLSLYGNCYEENLVTANGVVGLNYLPPPTVRRVESLDGSLIGFVQDITGSFTADGQQLRAMLAGSTEIPRNIALFEDWQVTHMRLRDCCRRSPYGQGVGEGARWIWKRLIMLEDLAMISRLTRIPRYAYYVDVTDVPSDRVESFLRKTKRDLKKRKMVNPRTGRLDMRYDVLSQDEDVVIAVRDGKELARVDILSAPEWNSMEDVDYFKRMLHGTLNVPRAWLGQDEPIQGRAILSNEDVRAGRVTLGIQREIRNGYERICRVHLAAKGIKNPYGPEFIVMMTAPSGIWELAAYEVMNARADYASRVQPFTSNRWIQENVLRLTNEEIEAIEKQSKKEQEQEQAAEMAASGGAPEDEEEEEEESKPNPKSAPEPKQSPQPGVQPGSQPASKPAGKQASQEDVSQRALRRHLDKQKRLEDWRYRESCRRHQEITDKLGSLMEGNSGFAGRERERRAFFKEMQSTVLRRVNGKLMVPPSATSTARSRSMHPPK